MDNKITFIIPNRGGTHIDFVIKKLDEFYPESKYIVITQDDNKPFMRGQLFNIAYTLVDTEYMCFIDNDMFFPEFIDIIGEYNKLNCLALQPFANIRQVELTDNGGFKMISEAPKNKHGKGGATFISKSNFEKIGGMSNLYIGYGCEDTDFDYRCHGIADLNTTICHIQHERRNKDIHWGINKQISSTKENRNIIDDNYKHTTYNIVKKTIKNNTTYVCVNNIGVCNDFKFTKELAKHG